MAPQIFPLSRSHRFSFHANECLYRGFNGERVLADAEGPGLFTLHRCDLPLTVVRDGSVALEFPVFFRDTLLVSAEGPGEFMGDVTTAVPEGLDSQRPEAYRDVFEGCGWLVGGVSSCQVDGRHEPISFDGPPRPIPIFRGLQGTGEFQVVADRSTRCLLADALSIEDAAGLAEREWVVQNMSKLRELESSFEDGTPHRASIASHLNAASWVSPIPPDNRGILIRKLYDRFHGRQRARVKVDGEPVGTWYEPMENRHRRWAVSEFGVPAEFTQGKSSIRITVDPPPGTALWSVSRVEIWALVAA